MRGIVGVWMMDAAFDSAGDFDEKGKQAMFVIFIYEW